MWINTAAAMSEQYGPDWYDQIREDLTKQSGPGRQRFQQLMGGGVKIKENLLRTQQTNAVDQFTRMQQTPTGISMEEIRNRAWHACDTMAFEEIKEHTQVIWDDNRGKAMKCKHPSDGINGWSEARDNSTVSMKQSTGRDYKPSRPQHSGEGGTVKEKEDQEMMDMLAMEAQHMGETTPPVTWATVASQRLNDTEGDTLKTATKPHMMATTEPTGTPVRTELHHEGEIWTDQAAKVTRMKIPDGWEGVREITDFKWHIHNGDNGQQREGLVQEMRIEPHSYQERLQTEMHMARKARRQTWGRKDEGRQQIIQNVCLFKDGERRKSYCEAWGQGPRDKATDHFMVRRGTGEFAWCTMAGVGWIGTQKAIPEAGGLEASEQWHETANKRALYRFVKAKSQDQYMTVTEVHTKYGTYSGSIQAEMERWCEECMGR